VEFLNITKKMEAVMKFLKIFGIVILVIIVLIVILGFIAPKGYHAERTVSINAPKAMVFNQVKYWRNWQAWSPWAEQDSAMQIMIEGTDGEVGSGYKWIGDPDITGRGEMTNTGLKEGEEITYHLHFLEPWESESDGYVRLMEGESGEVEVAWGFQGEMPFPWNIMMLFTSMNDMIGKDFDRGLTLLKDIVEKEKAAIERFDIQTGIFPAKNYAGIRNEVPFSEMQTFFQNSYAQIQQGIQIKRLRVTGAPAGLYYSWDMQHMKSDMAAAFAIRGNLKTDQIQMIHIPAQTAYRIDYYGGYEGLYFAHMALGYYLNDKGLTMKMPCIEEYITDPTSEPDTSKWLTKIYYFAE
jgi:effector-binding domain-containing protein